jgi:hypothetical protein
MYAWVVHANVIVCQDNALKRELAALVRQKKRLQQDRLSWGLTALGKLVSVAVYVLSKYDVAIAQHYVRMGQAKRRRQGIDAPTEAAPITDWYMELSQETIVGFWHPSNPQEERCRTAAEDFLAEYGTMTYVRTLNFNHGVAPSATEVAAEYGRLTQNEGLQEAAASNARSSYRWCQHFAHRWGICRATLKLREEMPAEILEAKAGCRNLRVLPRNSSLFTVVIFLLRWTLMTIILDVFYAQFLTPVPGPLFDPK